MILPSEATPRRWSPDHQRLHRHLLQRPRLLPAGAALLLAVSGGQDSMALTALLHDLRRLHGWRLQLWHGDHGWRPESGAQALALAAWAEAGSLPLLLERAATPPAGEDAARQWRYGCLERAARRLACTRLVTGHTASDRAETVLLNLARGSHRMGLASLRAARSTAGKSSGSASPLEPGEAELLLVRPLLPFSREDTARICHELQLPVWNDPTNGDLRLRRNRVRSELLPVLEELHPGASRRIALQAERLEGECEAEQELLQLALGGLAAEAERPGGQALPVVPLARRRLGQLHSANRRRLLREWLKCCGAPALSGAQLDALALRLQPERGPGHLHLAGGWRLHWDRSTLNLQRPDEVPGGDG